MSDIRDLNLFPEEEATTPETTEPNNESLPLFVEEGEPTAAPVAEPTWRNEAGRKGAKRIHQLIAAGRLYEKEHGLKRGRQRLRQLIELGKLYEVEHGMRPAAGKPKTRLSRGERDEVVATLLQCLIRIARPSFRPDLERLLDGFHNLENRQAA